MAIPLAETIGTTIRGQIPSWTHIPSSSSIVFGSNFRHSSVLVHFPSTRRMMTSTGSNSRRVTVQLAGSLVLAPDLHAERTSEARRRELIVRHLLPLLSPSFPPFPGPLRRLTVGRLLSRFINSSALNVVFSIYASLYGDTSRVHFVRSGVLSSSLAASNATPLSLFRGASVLVERKSAAADEHGFTATRIFRNRDWKPLPPRHVGKLELACRSVAWDGGGHRQPPMPVAVLRG